MKNRSLVLYLTISYTLYIKKINTKKASLLAEDHKLPKLNGN